MSRVNIVNATAEDFKIEVLSSAPSNGSSGDHTDGRMVKYLKNMYLWHDSSGEWIKFPNLEDYQSLETRLSAQESDRAAADGSLQTIDLSLQTRIAAEETARSQAVSSEASSMASADSSLTTRIAAAETARSQAVSSEASSEASATTSLNAKISTASSARVAGVSAEASRAASAEDSIQLRTSQEESNEASAEASLDARVSAQSSSRVVAVNSVATVLGTATSNRSSADTSLETLISTEEARIDAMLNAAAADKDTFVEVVSFINATDVTSDGELSTEFSTLTSSVASAATARGAADASLTTRLSTEESVRLVKDNSLETRLAAEESNELSAEVSLDARSSAASSARLSADTSIASNISDAASNRGSADTSLTTRISTEESARLSAVTSLNSRVSSQESTRGSAVASLDVVASAAISAKGSGLSSIEASVSTALSSEASSMASADTSLTTRIAAEETARANADSSLSTELSSQASARASADLSLTTRLSIEESVETSAEASHNVRISTEASAQASADASLNVKFSGEFSTERSRIDAILDSAAADKDTFVEVVSFLTAVDSTSDDVLASYVVSIDADISSEASTQASADASLTTRIAAEETARSAAVSTQASSAASAEASINVAVSTLESHEDKRHVRIDFTSQTSFSVAAADLPTGFTAGNGMVQIFHEVSSGTFRHLVAPATVNPSTGAMTFDLGSSAKSGFAVFYSFAGDETTVTEKQLNPQILLTGVDSSSLSFAANAASEITLQFSGIGSLDNTRIYNDLGQLRYAGFNFTDSGFGPGLGNPSNESISVAWDSGYNNMTISWTNASDAESQTGGNSISLSWGDATTVSNNATLFMQMRFDSNGTIDSTYGVGKYLNDGESLVVSPDYILASNGISAFTQMQTHESNGSRYFRGPEWQFDLEDSVYLNTATGLFHNFGIRLGSSSATKQGWYGSVRMVISGSQRYIASNSITSTHRLYSEITSGASLYTPSSAQANRTNARAYYDDFDGTLNLAYWGRDQSGSISNTSAAKPDNNTDVEFYFAAAQMDTGSGQGVHPDSRYDMKIVISMSDGTASNMSVQIYRSDADLSSPSWTEVDRGYLGGHKAS